MDKPGQPTAVPHLLTLPPRPPCWPVPATMLSTTDTKYAGLLKVGGLSFSSCKATDRLQEPGRQWGLVS